MKLSSSVLALLFAIASVDAYSVLIIGGTRFSGASLWKELHDRGHQVTLYNRGKTAPKPVGKCGNHNESEMDFQYRLKAANFLKGDRKDPAQLKALIDPTKYDYVYDMNARTVEDTKPLAELFVGTNLKQYIFMSSAGVYLKSEEMPHMEIDPVDPNSRHKGKLDSEACLNNDLKLPWCSFRPTYICGPGNYNPVERFFFERLDSDRPVCIPGHGQHLTGLGHVYDLAVAMANCIDRESITTGKVYNCQNTQAITFDGVAKTAAKVMGKPEPKIVHFEPKDFKFPEGKKAFPMRPQHFFTSSIRAMQDLNWKPVYDSAESILADAYHNDFVHVKAAGGLKGDFECDDIILQKAGAMVA